MIGIEENKPEAIAAMGAAVRELGYPGIEVKVLKKRYPQGGEKQLIDAVMHRQVGSGGLPIDVGAVVPNAMPLRLPPLRWISSSTLAARAGSSRFMRKYR